jgi:hypothetical protein
MAAGEAPPPIVQDMVVGLRADLKGDQLVIWRALLGLAPSDQVRPRSADRIFNHVGEKGCEHEAYPKAEDRNMAFMPAWPGENDPRYEGEKRYACTVADQPAWDAMGQSSMGPAPRDEWPDAH